MQNFVSKALADAAEQARDIGRDLGRHLILLATAMMIALVFALVGLGFLTAGAYLWLSAQYGQLAAVLGIGGFYIVVAALVAIAATGMKPPGAVAKAQAAVKPAPVADTPNVATPPVVETLLKVLDDGGHHNERLAVLATSEAIKNAKPMQLIVTGLVAGFAGGQLLKQTMKKRHII